VTVLRRAERAQLLDDRQLRRLAKSDEVRAAFNRSREAPANASSRYVSQEDPSLRTERATRPAASILQRSGQVLTNSAEGRGADRLWRHLQLKRLSFENRAQWRWFD